MQNYQVPLSACACACGTVLSFLSLVFPNSDDIEIQIRELWKRNYWAGKVRLQRERGFCGYQPSSPQYIMDKPILEVTRMLRWGVGFY